MTDAPRVARARAALALRRPAMAVLAGAPLGEEDRVRLVDAGADAWSLLLAAECCALPLAARMRAAGLIDALAADVARTLADAERRELQRVMAARAALLVVDEAAAELGLAPVVLKGGAVAGDAAKAPIDLGDVDVLAPAEDAARLWQWLRDAGWSEKPERGVSPLDPDDGTLNHFIPLLPPGGGLPVELHRRVHYGDATRAASPLVASIPLRGFRALQRETGASVVVALLEHSVVQHPHRRGHLRDLVLVADALGDCDDAARARVSALIAPTRYAPELRDMLSLAESIAEGRAMKDPPSVQRAVARKYLLVLGDDARASARLPGWWNVTHIALERRALRGWLYARFLRAALAPVPATSAFRVRGVARWIPGAAHAAAWTARAATRVAYAGAGALSGLAARRRVDAVLRAGGG